MPERLFILNEPNALRLSPALAGEIGLNESIILLQIEFWISISNNEREGRRWTFQSIRDMQKKTFWFWGVMTIQRTLKSLINKGYLIEGNFNKFKYDRTRWFTLGDRISELKSVQIAGCGTGVYQNGTRSNQNGTRSNQNGTTIPETTTETTTEISQSVSEDIEEVKQTDLSACSHRQDGQTDNLKERIEKTGATKKQVVRAWQRVEEQRKSGTMIKHEEKYFLATLENEIEKDKLRKVEEKKLTLDEILLDYSGDSSDKASDYIRLAKNKLKGRGDTGSMNVPKEKTG